MAAVAALIGDPARAAMLHELCDERWALPAGELAARARVSPATASGLSHAAATTRLREARTCYDHLAGRLGVALTDGLCRRGVLAPDDLTVTAPGERWFVELGIDVDGLRGDRRPLTRACLDWSERRHHVSGALGAAFAAHLLDRGWVKRRPEPRAVELTPAGRAGLDDLLAAAPAPLFSGR